MRRLLFQWEQIQLTWQARFAAGEFFLRRLGLRRRRGGDSRFVRRPSLITKLGVSDTNDVAVLEFHLSDAAIVYESPAGSPEVAHEMPPIPLENNGVGRADRGILNEYVALVAAANNHRPPGQGNMGPGVRNSQFGRWRLIVRGMAITIGRAATDECIGPNSQDISVA